MRILVTGGAGFIGSNLVEKLLNDERVSFVRVLDNLATGSLKNIETFIKHPKFEFLEGDIRKYDTCLAACDTIDLITHQAALGSVPRSIVDRPARLRVQQSAPPSRDRASREGGCLGRS